MSAADEPPVVPGLGRVVRVPVVGMTLRLQPRVVGVGAVLVVAGLVLLVLAVGTGSYPIGPGEVVSTLLGGGDASTSFIVETIRLPRAVTALLVGAALGAGGAVFQSVTRNPLGSPDIIGFTAGSSAGAVLQIVLFDGGGGAIALGALAGGLGTGALIWGLAFRRGDGAQGYRLILVGLGIGFIMTAITSYLLTQARIEEAAAANVWITGSLNGRGWNDAAPVAVALVLVLPLLLSRSRELRMLEMGDDTAIALGVSAGRARAVLLVLAVVLTAVATSSAGPVLFVALAAPQISRRLTRATGPGVGSAALLGAVLLLASDFVAQRVVPSGQLPVGVVTGVAGGVFLIWLVASEWGRGRG